MRYWASTLLLIFANVNIQEVKASDDNEKCEQYQLESWNYAESSKNLGQVGRVLNITLLADDTPEGLCSFVDDVYFGHDELQVFVRKGCRGRFLVCLDIEGSILKQREEMAKKIKDQQKELERESTMLATLEEKVVSLEGNVTHLEEMVRQHDLQVVMVQTQNVQIKDLKAQQSKDAAEIRAQQQTIDQLEKLLANHTADIVSQKADINSLTKNLSNQSADITGLKTCTARRVAFMAVMSGSGETAISGDQRLMYDKVLVNTDNGFDPKTSQFTVTTPGVYMFSFGGLTRPGTIELDLTINSEKITSTLLRAPGGGQVDADSGFASAVVVLKAGDTVHIETEASWTSFNSYNQDISFSHQPNTFSGQLIHSDECLP